MKAVSASAPVHGSASQSATAKPVRLMLVDDSVVARAVLTRMIETAGGFEICAIAGTAEDALDILETVRVDIILLDLEMPGSGGLKALPRILEKGRGARVMIVSSLAEDGAEETVAALAMGAADTLPKPGTGRFNGRFSEILVEKLRALGDPTAYANEGPRTARVRPAPRPLPTSDAPLKLVTVGASTGGIHALGCFFAAMPEKIHAPILVTQHLPPAFISVFARQLATAAGRNAFVAEDGMILSADDIFVAPGDKHLMVERHGNRLVARLSAVKVSSGCLPSVDPMVSSAAEAVGSGALAVILTGMGRDGLEGAKRLVEAGGSVLAQDEASSAVWGMPRAVSDAGLAAAVAPPDQLGRKVASRALEVLCK